MQSGTKINIQKDGTISVEEWCAGFPYGFKSLGVRTGFADINSAYRYAKLLQTETITISHDVIDKEVEIEIKAKEKEEEKARELKELKRLTKKYAENK